MRHAGCEGPLWKVTLMLLRVWRIMHRECKELRHLYEVAFEDAWICIGECVILILFCRERERTMHRGCRCGCR